jgi:hypothetical protein
MAMKKQTAVDWLIESLEKLEYNLEKGIISLDDYIINVKWVKDQVKVVEKEQHFESYKLGNSFLDNDRLDFRDYFEQYYNENYDKYK